MVVWLQNIIIFSLSIHFNQFHDVNDPFQAGRKKKLETFEHSTIEECYKYL